MGKRRSKGVANADDSIENTPVQSDEEEPVSKRPKQKAEKSSAEICEELDLTDVELEYTDADYQNLTTFKFFVRMIRPQLTAVNRGLSATKLNQVMEMKWQEFQDSNPYKQSQEEILVDSSDDEALEDNDDSKAASAEEGSDEENQNDLSDESPVSSRPSSRAKKSEYISEDEDSSRSSRKKSKEKRSSLTIKMPMFGLRKSARDRSKTKKSYAISEDEVGTEDKEDEYAADSTADSEDYDQPRKSKRKQSQRQQQRKKRVQSEDSQSSDDSDSDSSYEKRSRKKKKKALKYEKPVIPGERKSSRKSHGSSTTSKSQAEEVKANIGEMTDREFEKMLRLEEKEKQRVKADQAQRRREKEIEKKRQERKKKRAEEKKNKKGYWQDKANNEEKNIEKKPEKKGGESGNESDHFWYCEVCKDGGDLMLCDTCPKSFHQSCINLNEIPDGDWSCPICTGEGLPEDGDSSNSAHEDEEEEEEMEAEHDQFCKTCKRGGDVILCDFCSCVYHLGCLNPPLGDVPEGDWKCPRCKIQEKPLKGRVLRVLTWRWDQQLKGTDETDHTQSPEKQAQIKKSLAESKQKNQRKPERELFVKFEYHSYWDCEWIPELALEVLQVMFWQSFRKQFDQNEPPALEDGSSFGKVRHKTKGQEDPHNLEERFYRYCIKPEWLQIDRILCHEGKNKDLRYLVKWRGLAHAECTWEFPSELHDGVQDWDKQVDAYQKRRKERMKLEEVKTKKKDLPKKSKWRKQLEVQPDYIEVTGCKLHPYQLEGLNWMRFSYAQDTNTILADEMGLGKTIQSISFLYALYKEGYCRDYPFIVAAPLSTVPNWEREFEMWAPDLYVVTYIGNKDNRAIIREREFSYREGAFHSYSKPGRMRAGFRPKFDVILTSYEMLNIDRTTLSSIEWGCIVIDEAHRLKNQQSLFFRSLSEYKLHYKLLLTGTPLQNNLDELFSLLNFLEPGKFDDLDNFLNNFSEISRDEQVSKLHEMLAPHMLRRLKMDVLKDLPAKSEFIIRVELSTMQKKFYKHVLTKNYSALNVKGHSNITSMANIMMDLRKTCNHPYLFPTAETEAPLTRNGLYEGAALSKASGKMDLLAKMLKVLRRDKHRVLIFSQMTRNLDLLEDFMDHFGYGYERIDGSIMGSLRQESIDRFNSGSSKSFVFLLSTRAGGLGINLASADTVIIYDMDWNPHNDIQAFSRAHRIGQKNKVMIFRFVTRNTVEEKIAQVCKKKMMLSELIVHKGMGTVGVSENRESLTKQEISEILKFGAEELFTDDDSGKLVYDDEMVEKILDRSQVSENPEGEEVSSSGGMNEYLRSFKVATYSLKEGADEEEEEEQEEEEEASTSAQADETDALVEAVKASGAPRPRKKANETDQQYWDRILRDAYSDHVANIMQEEEAVAKTLGKGKRVRKKINYTERDFGKVVEARFAQKKGNQSDYEPSSGSSVESEPDEDFDPSTLDENEKKLREEKIEKRRKRKEQKSQRNEAMEMPPLLGRVSNDNVQVLGFTARQRRAFLDAVMCYGMPPEDAYRSQWLVRELRVKPERVFKAYVSLFMRHLCEPVAGAVETFADGVPCEGLSRQHVLTRIGIMALIRKKVHDYEKIQGTSSMKTYKLLESRARLAEAKHSAELEKELTKSAEENKEGEDAKQDEKKEENEEEKSGEKEEEKGEDKEGEKEKGEDEKIEKKKEETEEEEKSEEKEKEEKSEDKDKEKSVENGDKSEEKDEEKENSEENKEDENKEGDEEDKIEDKEDERMETDEKEESEQKEESTETKKKDESEKQDEKMEVKESEAKDVFVVESKEEDDDCIIIPDPPNNLTYNLMTNAEIAAHFRPFFWIADGGFTELHNVWAFEERQLVKGQEHLQWHRIHDYWLLAGVVTHGYRHWQDILHDPRFAILNHAFKTEQEKWRKAPFLNKRFQLLQQSFIIEEQLRKSAAENKSVVNGEDEAATDKWSDVDTLSSKLKKMSKSDTEATSDPKMGKALNQVASLVSDIKSSSHRPWLDFQLQHNQVPPKAPATSMTIETQPAERRCFLWIAENITHGTGHEYVISQDLFARYINEFPDTPIHSQNFATLLSKYTGVRATQKKIDGVRKLCFPGLRLKRL